MNIFGNVVYNIILSEVLGHCVEFSHVLYILSLWLFCISYVQKHMGRKSGSNESAQGVAECVCAYVYGIL